LYYNNPMSVKKEKLTSQQWQKEALDWVKTIAFALTFAILMRLFVFEFVVVEQSSMHPTLEPADRLCISKITYLIGKPHRGDISVIRVTKGKNYVKRVIGLPGETIEIKDNVVYINGLQLAEDYLPAVGPYDDFDEITIPAGQYFVMGDNRPASLDSRSDSLGTVAENAFLGKVEFRLSPFTWF